MFDVVFKYMVVGMGIADHGVRNKCPEGGCGRGYVGSVDGDAQFKDGYEPIQPADMRLPNLMSAVDFDSEADARNWLTSVGGRDFVYQFKNVALVRSYR